ncbi:hypothetical protein GWK41_09525 [Persephonella atlantica]|uniref:Uncharacterized protein n=1 Tax=Persephonella atlantica TaxID=2699429 RepID=A0ABS1GK57_9AQUI|nr:hypothetical protein [Persephonella atlantica]MBK3333308.1 hypothetical protein [Persephonella atlantica]
MLFLGIQCNQDRTFTAAVINESRQVISITNLWKEGLIWYLDHINPSVVAVNFSLWFKENQTKNAYEIIHKLIDIFDFVPADREIKTAEKLVIKTDTDLFFKQLVRKELLPIKTREGIEQRIYNLPKAGITVKPEMLSADRNKLQKEVISIGTAFASYSVYHGQFTIEERNNDILHIPVYRYIPKSERQKF